MSVVPEEWEGRLLFSMLPKELSESVFCHGNTQRKRQELVR